MRSTQKGFTLIELVVVIVILGILAATAIPRFINLEAQANQAAADGVAGAIASAAAINYGASSAGNAGAVALTVANVCTDTIIGSMMAGGMPAGWTVEGTGATTGDCATAAAGDAVSCTVENDPDETVTATATVICTG